MRNFAYVTICAGALLSAQTALGSASQKEGASFLSPEIFGGRVRSPQGASSGETYAPPSPLLDDDGGEGEEEGSQSVASDDERFTPSPPPGQGHTYTTPPHNILQQDLRDIAHTHEQIYRTFQGAQGVLMQLLHERDEAQLPPEILEPFFQAFEMLQKSYQDLTNVVRGISDKLDHEPHTS